VLGEVETAGVAPATLGFAGSWASVGEHKKNQIEEEGEVDDNEEAQSPIS
jgi:hypothetical protein